MLDIAFFDAEVTEVASRLLGATLLVDGVGGTIVETEAYERLDPASHSYSGPTRRNRSMFGPPGHAYVYRSYGVHWCLNFVCRPGSAVLIRALAPTAGVEAMAARRGNANLRHLCSGPGKLCQALAVSAELDGAALDQPPFQLQPTPLAVDYVTGPRIGISRGVDAPWRFGVAGSDFLSRPFRSPQSSAPGRSAAG